MKCFLAFATCVSTFILTVGCNNFNSNVEGGWVIEKWDAPFDIITPGLDLKTDGTCDLPMTSVDDRHTNREIGVWSTFKQNGKIFLKIETANEYFNRTFQVLKLEIEIDSMSYGKLYVMTLVSDNIKMICKKQF